MQKNALLLLLGLLLFPSLCAAQIRTKLTEQWNPLENQWQNSTQVYQEIDTKGRILLTRQENWDTENENWKRYDEQITEYDDALRSVLVTTYGQVGEQNAWGPYRQLKSVFDQQDNLLEQETYSLDFLTNLLELHSRKSNSYDENGCISESIAERFLNPGYEGTRTLYEQDEACLPATINYSYRFDPQEPWYPPYGFTTYFYGPDTTLILKEFVSEQDPILRDTFIEIRAYDPVTQQLLYDYREQDGPEIATEIIYEYDSDGNQTYSRQRVRLLEPADSPWQITAEEESTFENGLQTHYTTRSEFVDSLDAWLIVSDYSYVYNEEDLLQEEFRDAFFFLEETYFGSKRQFEYYCNGNVKESVYFTRQAPEQEYFPYLRDRYTHWDTPDCDISTQDAPLTFVPNPAPDGKVWVYHPAMENGAAQMWIYDSTGREMVFKHINYQTEGVQLSLPNLVEGIYFVRFQQEEGLVTGKLLVRNQP